MFKSQHIIIALICLGIILAGCGSEEKITQREETPAKANDPRQLTADSIKRQETGAYDEAIEILNQALKADPQFAPAYYRMGVIYEEWDKRPEALKSYKKAIEIDPEYADARLGLASVYSKSVLNDLAVDEYLKVAEKRPDDPEIHFQIALQYWYLQQIPQTAEYYRKVIEIDPQYLQAHLNLVSVYERMQEWEKALEEIAISLHLARETQNQQAISIAENKLAILKGRMNLTAEEMKRRTEPPFE